jgi:hypothetical protein
MGIRAPELTCQVTSGKCQVSEDSAQVAQAPWSHVTCHVSLADALAQFTALREIRATNPDYLRRCARCFLKGLCEQCPAKSWEENGTLDTPVEYLCEVAHAQARWLGWLGENEYGWEVRERRERIARFTLIADG